VLAIVLALGGVTAIERGYDGRTLIFAALGCVVLAFAYLIALLRRGVALGRRNNVATRLLNSGDARAAAEEFEALVKASGTLPFYCALFLANLGVARLRMVDLDAAVLHLTTALESDWFDRALAPHRPGFACGLALALAAKGDAGAARHWHQRAHAWVEGRGAPARLVLADVVFMLREGRFAEASRLLTSQWAACEGAYSASQMRALRLLHAFALEGAAEAVRAGASGGEAVDAADSARESIATMIAGAKPAREGEFGYLSASWPAFHAFLARHGFARA
jgi:hypothetical protein